MCHAINTIMYGDMECRKLGSSGLRVSALIVGLWLTFGDQVSDKDCPRAYDTGL